MLTKKTQRCLALSVHLMYISRSGPIKWQKSQHNVKFINSTRHIVLCWINFVIMVLYEVFIFYRTLQYLFPEDGQINLQKTCHLLYTLSCYAIPVHLQINTFLKWREIPAFINSYIDFFNKFKSRYVLKNSPPMKNGCETLCKTFIILAGLITLQNAVLIFKAPDRPFYLTSLLENPKQRSILLKLPFILLHLHIWTSFWAQLLFYGHLLYTYAFPSIRLLREMTCVNSVSEINKLTSDKLRQPHVFMGLYRCIQLQQIMFNFCCRDIFFPGHKVVMAGSVIFAIYGAIKLEGNRTILMAFVACTGLLYLSILFRRMGKFFTDSEELLCSWKWHGQHQILKRFLQSTPPVGVEIGHYYTVQRTTVISFIGVIVTNSINMLLSF